MEDKMSFCETAEQRAKLEAVIEESRSTPGCLMHILQEAQAIYGYLPIEVQSVIAQKLHISLSEVYGVATFYSQFSLLPKGKNRISVCKLYPLSRTFLFICSRERLFVYFTTYNPL